MGTEGSAIAVFDGLRALEKGTYQSVDLESSVEAAEKKDNSLVNDM